jgi:hypothetical protein
MADKVQDDPHIVSLDRVFAKRKKVDTSGIFFRQDLYDKLVKYGIFDIVNKHIGTYIRYPDDSIKVVQDFILNDIKKNFPEFHNDDNLIIDNNLLEFEDFYKLHGWQVEYVKRSSGRYWLFSRGDGK